MGARFGVIGCPRCVRRRASPVRANLQSSCQASTDLMPAKTAQHPENTAVIAPRRTTHQQLGLDGHIVGERRSATAGANPAAAMPRTQAQPHSPRTEGPPSLMSSPMGGAEPGEESAPRPRRIRPAAGPDAAAHAICGYRSVHPQSHAWRHTRRTRLVIHAEGRRQWIAKHVPDPPGTRPASENEI